MLGIKYNSKEGIDFVKKLCQLKENITWTTSALLANEKGVFPLYDKEKFINTEYFKSDRITKETKDIIKKYGVRNAKTSTNPPLGNSSVVCDNVSNAIEPVFQLEYERKVICDWPEGLNSVNVKSILTEKKEKDFTCWRGEYNNKKYYYEPHNRGLCEIHIIRDYGYQWILDNNYPKDHESIITTEDLEVEDHLNIQEVVQYYCNQSVSKTCNLPNNYSFPKFKNLYMEAWKKGLNGFTTYREGSMESVLGSLETADKDKEIIKKDIKLPEKFINGTTTTIKREGMKFYIHFSYLPDDLNMKYPVAMWIYTNSKGEALACNRACKSLAKLALEVGIDQKIIDTTWDQALGDLPNNRLARFISLNLRHNVPREDILVSLTHLEGDNISSLLTAVRKFIGQTIADGKEIVGMNCPNCKSTLKMESGCFVCKDCGYAGCG
jgi:ribonucleoside-diphosphate reductase alpha chain